MRRTTGPRETGNALFACQLGVCAGRGSEPETAHVCNAFTFISRSTLGVAIGRLEGDLCQMRAHREQGNHHARFIYVVKLLAAMRLSKRLRQLRHITEITT